ncbi:MAG: Gfo/Idh/MocA family oxidoreductase [Pseudomonadota bacterium]
MTTIAIVGVGEIARNAHRPAIDASDRFELVATASRSNTLDGIAAYPSLEALLAGVRPDAVALTAPPEPRFDMAMAAINAGLHVALEKPPGLTLSEVAMLEAAARKNGVTLFATWHSRFAPAVAPLKTALAGATVERVDVVWQEDVNEFHPGQTWIFDPGGFGVFDPGINALSVLTEVLPEPMRMVSADLAVPPGKAEPVEANLSAKLLGGAPVALAFDFLAIGAPTWTITVTSNRGVHTLTGGGTRLDHDGATLLDEPQAEYKLVYEAFGALIDAGASDVDVAPLRHVADAKLLARHRVGPRVDGTG